MYVKKEDGTVVVLQDRAELEDEIAERDRHRGADRLTGSGCVPLARQVLQTRHIVANTPHLLDRRKKRKLAV
jgi:hypothetical protein